MSNSTSHMPKRTRACGQVVDLKAARARYGAQGLERLLERRDRLAATAAAYAAHDLRDDWLWTALHEVEEAIAHRSPQTWRALWATWVEQDTARMHDQHAPQFCVLCTPTTPPPAADRAVA